MVWFSPPTELVLPTLLEVECTELPLLAPENPRKRAIANIRTAATTAEPAYAVLVFNLPTPPVATGLR